MPGFLRGFSFDQLSFWLGFLTGFLFWWYLNRTRPILSQVWQSLRLRLREARTGLTTSVEARHRNDTLRFVQQLHLASPLFSLDEILVAPSLLAPPIQPQPGSDEPPADIANLTIPYLPDWPELASQFNARRLSFAEALSGGANLILIGQPGSGKTVALAHLACQIARRDPSYGELAESLPFFIHISDLLPEEAYEGQLIERLYAALAPNASTLTLPRLSDLLRQSFETGHALLLLDGLDEAPPALLAEGVSFLESVLQQYPATRIVAAASTDNFTGLPGLGLIPLALAAWGEAQQRQFLNQWGAQWRLFIANADKPDADRIMPSLLNAWLLGEDRSLTPLEFTLRTWAAYAGDALGPGPAQAIEAYLRRMTAGLATARPALEALALQMIITLQHTLTPKEARAWSGEIESPPGSPTTEETPPDETALKPLVGKRVARKLPGILPDLLERGLLVERLNTRLSITHPTITAYLAASALSTIGNGSNLQIQPTWIGKSLTLAYLSALGDIAQFARANLEWFDDPLLRDQFSLGRWLRMAPKEASWRSMTMRFLANTTQRNELPLAQRTQALMALLTAGDPGVGALLRHWLSSTEPGLRCLAAFGSGYLQDVQAVPTLSTLINDSSPAVSRAACLALVTIGDKRAIESLASALLHGEESLRRSAAEVLALHSTEGHPLLKDGSQVEDLLVRRSVVHGLVKIRQPWARQILEKMAIDDEQWIVRSAATHALEEIAAPIPYIPHPHQELSDTPWLIAFGSQRAIGVSPGEPALELLLTALKEGDEEQKLAAMEYLRLHGDERALPLLYQILAVDQGELREVAFTTLWHMAAAGISLSSPATMPPS
jgi:HEAT repeat protein